MELTRNRVKSKTAKKRILFVEKVKTRESRDQYHLIPSDFFQWGWITRLEYGINCRLFTKKWHVMRISPMWQSEI